MSILFVLFGIKGGEPLYNVYVLKRLADENYTPRPIIEMVRSVMGGIDLDPTSTPKANEVVGATKFYAIEDNALVQPWTGRVFMNPPYSCSGKFVHKLVKEYADKNVTEAIVLLNAYTDTSWYHLLANSSSLICLTRGRLGFWKKDPESIAGRNRMGQCIAYLGPNKEKFLKFCRLGTIFEQVKQYKPKINWGVWEPYLDDDD